MKYIVMVLMLMVLCSCTDGQSREMKKGIPTELPTNEETTEMPTEAPLIEKTELLGEAVTKLYDKSENRIINIKLASSYIDGFKLAPSKKFSFNETTGKRSEEKGYKVAAVLSHKEKAEDVGGGVCQLASTIHMAAKQAGISVEERHAHQKKVIYAGDGDDAAVNYGTLDLVIANNTENDVLIRTGINEDTVTAQIYTVTYE